MAVEGFEFKLLGPLEVSRGGCVVPIRAAKLRVVLASLLIEAPRVVTVDQLITRLWNDHIPGGAQGALRSYVMRLRQALGTTAAAGPIMTCAEGYCVDLSGHDLDLHRFKGLVSQARTAMAEARMDRALALLCDALRSWRGDPLSNVPSDVLRRQVHSQLEDQWLLARELRADAALAQQRYHDVIADSGDLTIHHPLRERFWAQRMLALYLSGRQAEALKCYQKVRELLAEELGIDPNTELQSLHQAILENDPGLQPACPGSANRLLEVSQVDRGLDSLPTQKLQKDILHGAPELNWRPPTPPRGPAAAGTEAVQASTPVSEQHEPVTPVTSLPGWSHARSEDAPMRQVWNGPARSPELQCDRAQPPLPSELAVESTRSFVSRTAELELAKSLMTDRTQDRLAVLWLLGEPGIGKTRLATEIARRAHSTGAVVLFGRCNEDLSVPYQPFLEALQWHVAHISDSQLADQLGDAPAELTRLIPEIGARLSGLEAPQSTNPEIEQHRLFEAVRTWLAAADGGRPLVFVLDDVHWAARPTLALLGHVARSAEPSRALLVCAARDTSPDHNEALASLVDELDRRGALSHRLKLTGLSVEAMGKLVESATGRPIDDRMWTLVTKLHSDTAGNPLFVDALLASLIDPALQPTERHRTLATTVGRRMARLPNKVAELLRTASVAGFDFDLRVAALAAGCDEAMALEALEVAEQAGLVDEDAANRYRFRHALVRSVLREQLSQSRRVRVHLQIGKALEAVHCNRLYEHATALAYHFSEAVSIGAAPRAYRYTLLAAERATRVLSHDEAVDAYAHALELLDQVDGMDALARYNLLVARSEAQRKAGNVIGALDTLRTATEEAATHKSPEQQARAAILFEETSFWLGFPGGVAVELLQRAEEAFPTVDSTLRALTLASFSRALGISGRPEGTERGHEALAMAERLGDPITSFAVHLRTSKPYTSVEHAHVSSARWMDLCINARRAGGDDSYLLGLVQALWATAMLGDLTKYDDLFAEYSRFAVHLRQPGWKYWLDLFRAFRAVLAADLEAAEQFLHRAGFGWASEGLYGVAMFLIRREQKKLTGLIPAIQAAVHLNPGVPVWRPGLAALYTELGMLEKARQEFESLLSEEFAGLPVDGTRELGVGLLAEVCVALSDAPRAPWFIEQLRPCEGRFLVSYGCAAGLGPTNRLLGMLASTVGRPDDAERWHRTGLELARRLNSPLWIAHCLYDYAAHLRYSHSSRAMHMLAEAANICDEHRLATLGERTERLLATCMNGQDDM